jgi:hypothetical protein
VPSKLQGVIYNVKGNYVVTEDVLKLVYFAYAQSQILYSVIIWGASPHMKNVFVAQKRVVRAMAGVRYWRSNCALESCRPLFQRYGIMTACAFSLCIRMYEIPKKTSGEIHKSL